jgi:hypothetical protein
MSSDDPAEPPAGTSRPWSPRSWQDDPDRELDWARERDRDRDRELQRARAAREREEQRRRELARQERLEREARQERQERAEREQHLHREGPSPEAEPEPPTRRDPAPAASGPRGRRVRRTIRHLDPWSVLKMGLLFNAAVFLIVCVASALLWGGARASGTLDDVEDFVTSLGVGSCTADPGAAAGGASAGSSGDAAAADTGDGDCPEGQHLEGEFHFEDLRVLEVFAFGGVVMVLASTGAMVVLALLFNLMSDLTGGIQVWVVEDEPRRRDPGSPASSRRG